MLGGLLTMSAQELDRLGVVRRVLDRIFSMREVRTMTANLVVRYDCNEYVVTYGPTTKALVGRRRDVELHRWADGRLEIHWQGKSLPYVVQQAKPLVSPGEIVERKRVAEVMTTIKTVQDDPSRHRQAAARQLRPEIEPTARPRRRPSTEAPSKLTAPQLEDVRQRTRYALRWSGGNGHLYERVFTGVAGIAGIGPYEETYLGQVDPKVARRWEGRGDNKVRPPLKDGKMPPGKHPRQAARPSKLEAPAPAVLLQPAVDSRAEQRLGAALWFANSFHSVEAERVRQSNADVDKLNREWFKEMTQTESRKAPRRAAPPPRPLAWPASARAGQGSPRFARRLRRP
jgi:hypothetical protein